MDPKTTGTLIVIIIFAMPWILWIATHWRKKRLDEALKLKEKEIENLNYQATRSAKKHKEEITETQHELERITKKYQPIIDIESHVAKQQEIIHRAEAAAKIITDSASETKREILKSAQEKAETLEQSARKEHDHLINYAKEQAEAVAGNAIEARDNAEQYTSVATAMKNAISGYHDDYLIPNHTLLDELAEEYSHKEAGTELKAVRSRIKTMIKEQRAAECDYAERVRRETAIHFVIDAFNGKVDSVLAKAKHDNYGKLKQEIIDAFAQVNFHGTPFKNARIEQAYLDTRLDELKWAVTVRELQLQEREEQRAIREEMREEEKVRKEIEKAMKETQKEERMLQKAMEKARAELATATDEQRSQFEAQILDLEAKLKEAENKEQRALSMAQQTRRGHVYVISNVGSFGEHTYKVGMTRRLEPMDRVKELGDASVPFKFDVHAIIAADDAPTLENELHKQFEHARVNKVNYRKEFFSLSLAEIRQVVERHAGTDIHWTMRAEAEEYRESQSLAKREKALETA